MGHSTGLQDDRRENDPKTKSKSKSKSAVERARCLKTEQNMFVVMRVCSLVLLSYLDVGFEPRCEHFNRLLACLLAAACC